VSNGEFLELSVDANAAAPVYGITVKPTGSEDVGVVILKPKAKKARWPKAGERVSSGSYSVVFALAFIGTTSCKYKVVAKKSTDDVTVKDCSWTSADGVNSPVSDFEVRVR
jgi:hypothetical protein